MGLRIAIDLHGTLDQSPIIQDFVIEQVKLGKHKVFVLSGSEASEIQDSLYSLFANIRKTRNNMLDLEYLLLKIKVLSVVDTCKAFNIPMIRILKDGKRNWYCDDALWWPMKAIICKEEEIDFLVDDKIQYMDFFGSSHPTKMIKITEENRNNISLKDIMNAY